MTFGRCGLRPEGRSFPLCRDNQAFNENVYKKWEKLTGTSESDDVNEDPRDIRSIRTRRRSRYAGSSIKSTGHIPKVNTPGVVVPAIFSGIVKILHIIMTTTDNVVFSDLKFERIMRII